jgi:hypothetical protein
LVGARPPKGSSADRHPSIRKAVWLRVRGPSLLAGAT